MHPLSRYNYPALRVCVFFVTGILLAKALTSSPGALPYMMIALLVLMISLACALHLSTSIPATHTILAVGLCVLAGAAKFTLDCQQNRVLPESLFRHPVVLAGTIQDPPTSVEGRVRFSLHAIMCVDGANTYRIPANVLVTLKQNRKDTVVIHPEYGMSLALAGMLMQPADERNPGEFSPRQYYNANGISMLMSVSGHSQVEIFDSSGGRWFMRDVVVPARRFVLAVIDSTVGGEEGEFLKGLLIGERSGLSPSTRSAFMNSGTTHVLAVSGSNVAVVALFLFVMLEFFRLPRWARALAASIGLVLYMMLTGNQSPVVRATIMALVFMIAGVMQQKSNAYNALGVSALIILVYDARQLFDVGFQLSYGAVLSIVYLYPKTNAWISLLPSRTVVQRASLWLLRICAVSVVATLGTLPMTAIYFGRVSIIGILANAFVIPATGLSVILGAVSSLAALVSPWLASVYASANTLLLHWTLVVVNVAGNSSIAYVDSSRFTFVDALPFYAALALFFHLSLRHLVPLLTMLFLVTLNIAVFYPRSAVYAKETGKLRVSFMDVGQGDAILVEFPYGKTMLLDAGPRERGYDSGERIVAPFLRRRGISVLDLLGISHPHNDHMGGVSHILRQFNVRSVLDGGEPLGSRAFDAIRRDLLAKQCALSSLQAGMIVKDFPDVRIYVLYPLPIPDHRDTSRRTRQVNTSLVMKLLYGDVSILLAGDAEAEEEQDLVDLYGDFLAATVLKAGHHGSSTSNTQEFLEMVHPSFAVISVGKNNKFGHPSPAVMQRFDAMHINTARTDEDGAVIFETDGRTLTRIDWR